MSAENVNDPVKELNLAHITFETCFANTDEARSSLLKELITEISSLMSFFFFRMEAIANGVNIES